MTCFSTNELCNTILFFSLNNLFKPKYKLIKNIQQLFVSLRHFEYQYKYLYSIIAVYIVIYVCTCM